MIINGDSFQELKKLQDNSVDSIVTDPPYDIGFMNKKWDKKSLITNVDFWKECLRVLKPGGHLLSFGHSRTSHRMVMAVEDAGFEIRDTIMWLYGCLTEDSEVLTRDGWKLYDQVTDKEIMIYDVENDIYKWEKPAKWFMYPVNKDTVFHIKNDYTDQLVSRNHRCLVERDGKLVFVKAEDLSTMERVPTLQEDFYSLSQSEGQLLQQRMQWKSKRPGMEKTRSQRKNGLDTREYNFLSTENEWSKQSSLERGCNLQKQKRLLSKSKNKVCKVSKRVSTNGKKRWLCSRVQISNGSTNRQTTNKTGVCASHRSQSREQCDKQLNVIQQQQRSQALRMGTTYNTSMATVTEREYTGVIFCPNTSTGAFVARRNGKVFITGNSGFPKSHNVAIAIDKKLGKKDEAKEWQGWGTALKPAYEKIILASKPLTNTTELDTIVSNLSKLEARLWLLLNAIVVEKNLKLNQAEQDEVFGIAQWNAESLINTQEDLLEVMDMSQLELAINTSLNIVSLCKNNLEENSKVGSTSITKMKTNQTTELKTLRLLVSQITLKDITKVAMILNGLNVDVSRVENLSFVIPVLLKGIQTPFVVENAMLKDQESCQVEDVTPNLEEIVMARKPLGEKTVAENVMKWGTGGINIDECRVSYNNDGEDPATNPLYRYKNKDKYKQVTDHGQRVGANVSFTNSLTPPNELGRFPANVILDSEVGELLDEQSGITKGSGKQTVTQAGIGGGVIGQYDGRKKMPEAKEGLQTVRNFGDSGGASRYFKSIDTELCASIEQQEHKEPQPNELGRFPANVILDSEAGELLDEQAPKVGSLFSAKRKKDTTGGSGDSWTNGGNKAGEDNGFYDGLGGASRFFYCAKVSSSERKINCENIESKGGDKGNGLGRVCATCGVSQLKAQDCSCENKSWVTPAAKGKNTHPTVKPIKLMEYLVKLVTRKGGVVLDPFAGSGSTGVACKNLGMNYIMIEREEEYCEIIRARLKEK